MLATHPSYPPVKTHQTAVFVYCPIDASDNYWERAGRFIWSFNHNETIKADIFLVRGNGIFPLGDKKASGGNLNLKAKKIPSSDLFGPQVAEYENWAQQQGYRLIVISANPGNGLAGWESSTPPVSEKQVTSKKKIPGKDTKESKLVGKAEDFGKFTKKSALLAAWVESTKESPPTYSYSFDYLKSKPKDDLF